jgi:hypothetical protein
MSIKEIKELNERKQALIEKLNGVMVAVHKTTAKILQASDNGDYDAAVGFMKTRTNLMNDVSKIEEDILKIINKVNAITI